MTEYQDQIDRINTEVSAQETLLDQALAAIANKAAGGGGSVETCTVTLNFIKDTAGYPESGGCTIYYANLTEAVTITPAADSTVIEDALKGSLLVITLMDDLAGLAGCTVDTINLIADISPYNSHNYMLFHVPDNGTITFG